MKNLISFKIIAVSLLFMLPLVVVAETDPIATKQIDDIQKGKNTANKIETLRVGKDVIVQPTEKQVINGQAVTLSSVNIFAGVGSLATSTNTITVAAPGAEMVGKIATIMIHGAASSNLIKIADSAPMDLSGDWIGGVDDVITLMAASTTNWLQVSESDN